MVGHAAQIGYIRNKYKILAGNPKHKRQLPHAGVNRRITGKSID
jgi:hypothetical protein